jgi:hypothetical protein
VFRDIGRNIENIEVRPYAWEKVLAKKVREKKTTRNAVINDLVETEFGRDELCQSKHQSE